MSLTKINPRGQITFNLKGKLIIFRTVGEHKILNQP